MVYTQIHPKTQLIQIENTKINKSKIRAADNWRFSQQTKTPIAQYICNIIFDGTTEWRKKCDPVRITRVIFGYYYYYYYLYISHRRPKRTQRPNSIYEMKCISGFCASHLEYDLIYLLGSTLIIIAAIITWFHRTQRTRFSEWMFGRVNQRTWPIFMLPKIGGRRQIT